MLPPLLSLSDDAAKQTFMDIADDATDDSQIGTLLKLTDNVPLAVTLLASVVAYEGCAAVLARWKSETTSLLSEGTDKQLSLERSIMISLSSPCILATPDALRLLSILSILPDGLSDAMLSQVQRPLQEILRCKTSLLRTSLAYLGHDGRLKALVPIREYVRTACPPGVSLMNSLRDYIYDLIKSSKGFRFALASGIVTRLAADMGNIKSLLEFSLNEHTDILHETLVCVLDMAEYTCRANGGPFDLFFSVALASRH